MKLKWLILFVALFMFSSVGMLMAQDSAPSLVGTTWQWESFASGAEAFDVTNPENYTVTFNEDGSVNIQADCNSVFGQYTSEAEGSVAIMMGPSTLMACPEGSHDQVFTIALSQITMYSFMEDGRLLLEVPMDSGSLVFSEQVAEAPSLVGTTWQWESFASGAEAFDIEDPQNYTITFSEDGSLFGRADCNNIIMQYVANDDGTISIMPGISTLAACPEGSLDQQFTAALINVAVFSFTEDGGLLLEAQASSGSLLLSAQPQVTGTMSYMQRIALPEDAFIRVQIEDVSRMDMPSVVIGEQIIMPAGAQVPIPFAVSFSPNVIQESNRYSLSVRITDANGRLLWITDSSNPVITGGNPTSDIEVNLVQVSS
ncbi:MAG: META domain-containing protein [Anaerolineae bacterium]|nr:META domain-containing protein [Anaerolineae bacterium]